MKAFSRILIALALCASPLLAGGLRDYKDWNQKPVAYFMTSEERAAWKVVTSDDQARMFVDQYLARRGGAAFEDEANKRAAMADKYLTVGKLPASKTLRGKIIVLFGPPSHVEVTAPSVVVDRREGLPNSGPPVRSSAEGGASDGNRTNGGAGESMGSVLAATNAKYEKVDPMTYALTYSGSNMPAATGRIDAQFNIAVEPNGRDRLVNSKQMDELNTMFEAISRASITNQ